MAARSFYSLVLFVLWVTTAQSASVSCTNPGTNALTTCNTCAEDQTYVTSTTVYCPADTCTCVSGSGYGSQISGQCIFGWGGLLLSSLNFGGQPAMYACAQTARNVLCSGHGTELPYEDFSETFLVGFWVQGTPQSPRKNPPPHVTSSFLAARCVCDTGYTTTTINCDTVVPCPPQNGGTPCGGSSIGQCNVNTAPNQCNCGAIYGDTASPPEHCCPRLPVPPDVTTSGTSPVCGGRGLCSSTGACVCFTGYAGTNCCPAAPGQTIACSGHGTCALNGICACNTGYTGPACQVNTQCPSDNPNTECSGGGVCTQFVQLENAITRGIYPQNTFEFSYFQVPGIANQFQHIVDYGVPNYILRLYKLAFFNDVSGNTTLSFWNSMMSTCRAASTREQCFRNVNLAIIARGDLAKVLAKSRYTGGHVMLWVADALVSLYPHLSFFDQTISSTITADISATPAATKANGLALLLGYDTFIDYTSPTLAASIPSVGSWFCVCNVDNNNQNFATTTPEYLPGGAACSASCQASSAILVGIGAGTSRAACVGFAGGVFHGVCQDDGTCLCSPYWGGTTCDSAVAGQCFNTSIAQAFPCTSPHNGQCIGVPTGSSGYPMFNFHCSCGGAWTGSFCQYSTCALPSHNTIECSNFGTCQSNGRCVCDVDGQLALSTSRTQQPILPVGQSCAQNGIRECGTFFRGTLSANVGTWEMCSGSGICVFNTTRNNSSCVCEAGAFGSVCQSSSCTGGCPDNAICDITQGLCQCQFAYSGVNCTTSLCQHGEPSLDGTTCQCDLHYTQDSSGYCSVVQCPLVRYSKAGPILCDVLDPVCMPNQDFTVNACCYDACEVGHCLINATTNAVSCGCDPPLAFDQLDGVCYPKCNGFPYFIVHGQLQCDCSSVSFSKARGEFVDTSCDVQTCENGLALTGGCSCFSSFTGTLCDTPLCGTSGTLDVSEAFCNCFPPWSNSRNGLCTNNTCGATGSVVVPRYSNGTGGFKCQCPVGYSATSGGFACLQATGGSTAGSSSGSGSSSSSGILVRSSSSSSSGSGAVRSSTGGQLSSSSTAGHSISSTARQSSTGLSSSGHASSTGRVSSTGTESSSGVILQYSPGPPSADTVLLYEILFSIVGAFLLVGMIVALVVTAMSSPLTAEELASAVAVLTTTTTTTPP